MVRKLYPIKLLG